MKIAFFLSIGEDTPSKPLELSLGPEPARKIKFDLKPYTDYQDPKRYME